MDRTNSTLNIYMWLAIVITIFGVVAYYRIQVNKRTTNVNNMEKIYKKIPTQLSTITDSDPTLKDKIFNYYMNDKKYLNY